MARGAVSVLAAAGVISVVTVLSRLEVFSARALASTPESLGEGRVWLLASSALVADRPAVASIAGFLVVGIAAVALCGARVVWVGAALGHVFSAAIVYAALDASSFSGVARVPDYGTSAIIAAWIGAIACVLWLRGRRAQAVALCVVSGLLGWFFKGQLTVLDTEHAVALAIGAGMVLCRPHAGLVVDRARQVMRQLRLVERHPEPGVDLRHDHPQLGRAQLVDAVAQQRGRVNRMRTELDLPR